MLSRHRGLRKSIQKQQKCNLPFGIEFKILRKHSMLVTVCQPDKNLETPGKKVRHWFHQTGLWVCPRDIFLITNWCKTHRCFSEEMSEGFKWIEALSISFWLLFLSYPNSKNKQTKNQNKTPVFVFYESDQIFQFEFLKLFFPIKQKVHKASKQGLTQSAKEIGDFSHC